jgi:AraC-like DNA-binding protein
MNDGLREQKIHGTLLYPLQLYQMTNSREQIFVHYHWHREVEILFILQGTLLLSVNEEKFVGTAGDIFWIGQEELHGMSVGEEPTQYDALVFPIELLNFERFDCTQCNYLNPLCRKERQFPTRIPRQSAHYGQAWEELLEIAALDQERAPSYQFATKASLFKFVSLLVQDELLQSNSGKEKDLSDFKIKNLKAILTYIQQHYSEKMSLPEIAQAFNLSAKYFSRYFKKNLNRSFVEHLNSYRIERAADLLLSTDLPIGQIALTVGFDNFSYFIKQFRWVHGCTPFQYRKQEEPTAMHQHGTLLNGAEEPPVMISAMDYDQLVLCHDKTILNRIKETPVIGLAK